MSNTQLGSPWEVVVRADSATKGWIDGSTSQILDGSVLTRALASLTALTVAIPEDMEHPRSGWTIEEVRLSAEINAEGGLRFVGAINVGTTGGIEVLLRRRSR